MNTGFDNMSYFIRQFKTCKGCTPSAFRKMKHPGAVPIV
ncbi:MAG: helix-turn-helix domain-containing protein [Lachnospiraceae bacterium]